MTGPWPLAVHDLGGHGPTLVLVHATGLHGRVWAPLARHLAGTYRCLAPDLRGHGASGGPPPGEDGQAMAWPSLADDLAAAVAALGAPVLGVGHSLGASVALLAEQAHPGTFAALYCFEPIGATTDDPPPPAPGHPLAQRAAHRRDDFGSRAEARAAYAAKEPFASVDPDALDAYVEGGFVDRPGGTVALACPPAVEAATFAWGLSHPVFRDLPRVAPPVTLAVGARSRAVAAADLARWAERLPAGRLLVLEALDHFAPLAAPAALAADAARALAGR